MTKSFQGILVAAATCLVAGIISTNAIAKDNAPSGASQQKAVLVTGASSGIGRKIAELLAAEGHFVYAGARKDKDLADLNKMANTQAIRLDVTVQTDIDAAVATITKAGRGLHGVVNNAGVAIVAPLIEVTESDLDFIFDVNIYGPYRITKAFAPLLIENKGRVSNISSISGFLSGSLFGPYSMSKHAIEAYTDSLARELARFDIKVSAVEPGNYKSEIGNSLLKRLQASDADGGVSVYEDDMQRMIGYMDGEANVEPEPDAVAEAVLHALFDENPKARYMVVPEQEQADWTVRKAMTEMVELNQDHPFSYDRAALIEMLDEVLAAVNE
jgi:NAD(P)-dependent dehydrogenase (short-subunit alcohol dehydrogenase family)